MVQSKEPNCTYFDISARDHDHTQSCDKRVIAQKSCLYVKPIIINAEKALASQPETPIKIAFINYPNGRAIDVYKDL